MEDECPFSGREFSNSRDRDYPYECPECGAIRTLKFAPGFAIIYPGHKTLMGTSRTRPHYKLINNRWQLVEKESTNAK